MQQRLSYAKTVDMARGRGDNDEDVNEALNGLNGGEEEGEEEEGKSAEDSLISEKDRQDLEAAMIEIEGKKRQTGREFARNTSDRFEHQMTSSAPPAMALPRRRASTEHQFHRSKEIGSLKRQLAELQTMVDTYERTSTPRNNRYALSATGLADTGSTISDMSFTESRHHHHHHHRIKGADSLLAEMSEQLQLQKELHLRRKDLEKLMKKDMMENIQKEHAEADDEDDMSMTRTSSDVRSDASLGGRHHRRKRRGGGTVSAHANVRMAQGSLGAWLDGSLVNGIAPAPVVTAPANHHRRLRQRSLSSNNSLSAFALDPASAAAAQIQILQRQVDKLQMEIGILNQTTTLQQQRGMNGSSADFLESASTMAAAAAAAANNLRQSPGEDDVRLQLQQHQMQLLTQSLTQCFQTLLSVQQDVNLLQGTVEKLVQHQHDLAQHEQQLQQQVSNSSSAIGIGQPQQQSATAPQQQRGNSPPARLPQPSLRMDNLNRGRGFDNWQSNIGDPEFVPILPMPAPMAVTNAEQQQQQHRVQSLSFAASSGDPGNVAAAFPEALLGVGPIEANNAQWIGASSQPQETLAIAAHPAAPPLPQVDDMGLWSLQQQQQTQQAALSLRNGLNQWSGETNIRPPPPPDHDHGHQRQRPTPVALNNQQPTPVALNNTADNWRSLFRQNRLSNGGSAGAAAVVSLPPFALQQPTAVSSSNGPQQRHQQHQQQQQQQQQIMGSPAPNVAQVTPRQIITCSKRPTCTAAPVAATMSSAAPPTSLTAFIEPNFGPMATAARAATAPRSRTSPPRPRRKQKINREQNRENATPILPVEANNSFANGPMRSTASQRQRSGESSSSGNTSAPPTSASAAMVFPIQQQQQQNRNLNSNRRQTETAADHANPVVNSLSRSIYSQVSHLISQHEQRPEQLARIFEDLQAFSRNSLEVAVNDTSAEVAFPDGAAGVWRYHTPNSQASASAIDHLQSLDSPKVNGKFSFNTIRDGERPQPLANDGRRLGVSEQHQQPVAIGSFQPFHNALSEISAIMEGSASNGNEQRLSEVAVPKNIQRNQISRERDGRKMGAAAAATAAGTVGNPFNKDRKSKPRNMQQFGPVAAAAAVDPTSPLSANSPENTAADDEAAFVSVPIKFHPRIYAANRETVSNNDVDAESEMAEADQDHSSPDRSADFLPQADFHTPDAPDSMTSAEDAHAHARADNAPTGAVGGAAEQSPEAPAPAALRLLLHGEEAEAGLDRVPTRLAPTELNAQIAAEETENGQNLVEEVLESSELPECVEQSVREPHGDEDE